MLSKVFKKSLFHQITNIEFREKTNASSLRTTEGVLQETEADWGSVLDLSEDSNPVPRYTSSTLVNSGYQNIFEHFRGKLSLPDQWGNMGNDGRYPKK